MNVKDKVAVVTGGASGIGLALCTRFAREGAQVVLSDLRQEDCEPAAAPIGAFPVAADVGREEDVAHLVSTTVHRFGRVDLFVSNAGIDVDGGIDTPTERWRQIFDVNVLSEVFAAKHVIPHMLAQGGGYLLNTASAAGLLMIFDTVSYTVTKHAAVGFTEWLAATYGDQGIRVSLLCPAGVATPILAGKEGSPQTKDVITTDRLVDIVMEALAEERFMISTHPFVLDKFAIKARDYEEYIRVMRADHATEAARTASTAVPV